MRYPQQHESSWTEDDTVDTDNESDHLDPRSLARRLFEQYPSLQGTREPGTDSPTSNETPQSIAGYQVKKHIGRGAFGNVYLCQEQHPPHRNLAIKVIRAGMDTSDVLARFEAEKNALSMMNHPAIARILDAGATEDGNPYFAMEHVEGVPLTEFCSRNRLTLEERLRLFIEICQGVQHAHNKAVVHRDLKPSNIMVTEVDGVTQAKIIDFGLVKSLQQPLRDQSIHTQYGVALGTFEYMSPEQVKSGGIHIDTRSDIYALGAILYELLTGELAFTGLRECGYEEIVRRIMRDDAVRPSQRIRSGDADRSRQHAATMQSELNSLSRCLATDLDWITMKALEKDPERRYQACQEMANDIERYLNGELVEARPPSTTYRLKKTVRRYRKTLTVTSLLILSLLMGMSWALVERDNARASQLRSDEVTEYLAGIFADIDLESMAVQLRRTFSNNKIATTETAGLNGIALEQHLQQTVEFTSKINWIELAKKSLEPGIINSSLNKTDAIEDPLQRAALLQILSNTLRKMASLDAAMVPQQDALAIRQRELGIDHPDTLSAIHNLGLLQLDQGNQLEVQASVEKHNDALRNFEKAHEGRLSVLGSDHRETLESTFAIAMVTMRIGKGRQAIDIFRKVLESRRRALGDHDPATLTSMQHLGVLLTGQGDNDEARLLLEEVLEIRRSELPADDRQLIGSMTSMANVLIYLEDGNLVEENLDEAQALLDEALDSCRRVFTEDHPTTLTVLKSMGKLFSARGKHAEAQQYYEEALAGFRRIEGNNSRNTLRMINDMGVLLLKQGKQVEAKLLLEEGLEGRLRVMPDNHIQIAMSYHNLGWVHRELGDLEKADFFGAEAVRRCHDRQQWCIGFVNWKYSLTLVALNRFAEAEIHAKKAWSRLETWKHFSAEKKIEYIEGRVALYDAWHKVEPDAGHDQSAARWRAKLEEAAAAT